MATAFTNAQLTTAGMKETNHDPTKKPGRSSLFVRTVTVNFDNLATSTGTALAADDTFQVMNLQPDEFVIAAGIKVLTVATGAADLDLGFVTTGQTAFIEALIIDDADIVPTQTGTMIQNGVAIGSTSDTLDILTTTVSCAGAVIKVWALIARI